MGVPPRGPVGSGCPPVGLGVLGRLSQSARVGRPIRRDRWGQEALQESREGLVGHPGWLVGVKMDGRGWKFLQDQEDWEALLEGREGLGVPY